MLCMPALPIIYWGTLANSEDPVDAAKCCMGLQCLLRLKHHSGTEIQGAFGKFLAWSFISVTNLQTISCLVSF